MKLATWRMGFAGDVLFSTAALEAIKRKYPKGHITYGVWPQYFGTIDTNPHIDNFVHDDDSLEQAKRKATKVWEISHEKYRMEPGEMFYWGEVHARQAAELGLLRLEDMESFKPQVYLASTDIIPKPADSKVAALGVFSKNGADARLWGMVRRQRRPLPLPGAITAALYAEMQMVTGDRWGFDPKCWPKLVEELNKMGYRCVQLGGKADPRVPGAVDLCGRLSWRQSTGLLTQADLCITIDSFLLHAAVARKHALDGSVISEGTPTVALLGPTDERAMFPADAEQAVAVQKRYPRYVEEGCCPCFHSSRFGKGPCKHGNLCMRSITVEDILEGVEGCLQGDRIDENNN